MVNSYGKRSGTRQKFAKPFKTKGHIRIARTLTSFKVGDYVDVKVDGSIHKGMPHKYYHGRTGRVYTVNPRSIGVILNKQVRNRIVQKKLQIRYEHLSHSKSFQSFVERIKKNDILKSAAKKEGKKLSTKRINAQPRPCALVKAPLRYANPEMFTQIF
jgi:large subunit ribosomal protein L21e